MPSPRGGSKCRRSIPCAPPEMQTCSLGLSEVVSNSAAVVTNSNTLAAGAREVVST